MATPSSGGDRWRRMEQIFQDALAQTPELRAEFVASVCGPDSDLCRQVQSLLEQHDCGDSLFENPPLAHAGVSSQWAPGMKVGSYTIIERVGAGGMGEVFRARDNRLNRDVAIKTVPPALARDPSFIERLRREAVVLAALNHPNVATLFGIEESAGFFALVMELVDGDNLAKRMSSRRFSVAEAVAIARQIADGVNAAHRIGIVHRDLKPGNVMISRDGHVKVLDFGLAKRSGQSKGFAANSAIATKTGALLGTPGYLSPEQAEGAAVDARSDIFAFGAMLYELVTGRKAFVADSPARTLTGILRDEPEPMEVLTPEAPKALCRLVHVCLNKDPERRYQNMFDVRLALDAITDGSPPALNPPRFTTLFGWMAAAVSLAALAAMLVSPLFRRGQLAPPVTRFDIAVPQEALQGFSVSPDGRMLAFSALTHGTPMIWLRELDSRTPPQPRAGTEGGRFPFWSPDSKSIAFFADAKLKRMEVRGGDIRVLCEAAGLPRGTAWSSEGVILFALNGLHRVAASGGTPVRITKPDRAREISHGWPFFLPGERRFIFFVEFKDLNHAAYASSIDDPSNRVKVAEMKVSPIYVPSVDGRSGYLLYSREGSLFAQRLDAARLRLDGEAMPVADRVAYATALELQASASTNGVLAYSGVPARTARITWVDRHGNTLQSVGAPDAYVHHQLSPDERRLVVNRDQMNFSTWIYDFGRDSMTRLTSTVTNRPQWSPDGSWIAFGRMTEGAFNLFRQPADGGPEERLTRSPNDQRDAAFSPSGRFLMFTEDDPKTKCDIWVLSLDKDRTASVFLRTPYNEQQARFSPDGKWVAYTSDESGRNEIYIRSFAAPGSAQPVSPSGRWMVSNGGGQLASWRGDGKELFYWSGTKLLGVAVRTADRGVETGKPVELFPLSIPSYAAARDGQRFIVLNPLQSAAALTVVTNWESLLTRRP